MGDGQLARVRCAPPYEDGIAEALSSDGKYNLATECGSVQLAMAGAMIAADLIETAEFDPANVYSDLGRFATACSSRGVGFAYGRLLAVDLWYAAVGEANGVMPDQSDQSVSRKSWVGEGCPIAEQMGQGMRSAANFASSLHAAAHRVNAFGVGSEGARRTMRAGFANRACFAFSPPPVGRFVLPAVDSPPRQVAPGNVSADGELSDACET